MLDYRMNAEGVMEYSADGVLVATVKPTPEIMASQGRFWVNMVLEGMPWSSMPIRSLEAAGYLILASYLEMKAKPES
jgi:hypothetical protein